MATACEILTRLKEAKLDLVTGSMVRRVRIQTGETDREVQYQASDISALDRTIAESEHRRTGAESPASDHAG